MIAVSFSVLFRRSWCEESHCAAENETSFFPCTSHIH